MNGSGLTAKSRSEGDGKQAKWQLIAIESIKQGAFHFLSKPYAIEELLSLCTRALDQQALTREAATLREEKVVLHKRLSAAEEQLGPVAISRRMREVEQLIARTAANPLRGNNRHPHTPPGPPCLTR